MFKKGKTLFVVKAQLELENFDFEYDSLDSCFEDHPLKMLLDSGMISCSLWSGSLKLSGKDLKSWDDLKALLTERASVILRRKDS